MNEANRTTSLFVLLLLGAGAFAGEFSVLTNGSEIVVNNDVSGIVEFHDAYLAEDGYDKMTINQASSASWLKYYPTQASTYEGGTFLNGGQLWVCRSDAMGTGPITLGSGSSLMINNCDLVFSNKIVFVGQTDSYACGWGDGAKGSVTLTSVGTSASAATHRIRIGRINPAAPSRAVLSLTDPLSEAVGRINLSGALELTLDGGTVKMRSDSENPFFNVVTQGDVSDVTVSRAGVTFDVEEGGKVSLGERLKFEHGEEMSVIQVVTPENNGFESGTVGPWKIDNAKATNKESGVKKKGTPWDAFPKAPPTGDYFLMMRDGAAVTGEVSLPLDGLWRVRFHRGCRTGYSTGMSFSVLVDGKTRLALPRIEKAADETGFECFTTEPFEAAAGSHVVRFEVGNSGTDLNSFNLDEISFEMLEQREIRGVVTKAGAGTLSFADGQDVDHVDIVVDGGTLSLDDATLADAKVEVRLGNVKIGGASVQGTNAVIDVLATGCVTVNGFGDNLVKNGSFEQDDAGSSGFAKCTPTGWKIEGYDGQDIGVQKNGGTVSGERPVTAAGTKTAFVRPEYGLSQKVTVARAGTYRLTFLLGVRDYAESFKSKVDVFVDEDRVLVVEPRTAYYDYERFACEKELSAGEHTIKFMNVSSMERSGGSMVFVDDVQFVEKMSSWAMEPVTLNLSRGATLRLDNVEPVRFGRLFVDGVEVVGGRQDITAAGVNVSGSGKVRAGEKQGLMIVIE